MLNEILAFWTPGPLELIPVFLVSVLWLILIILPVLYVVHSIKARRRILTEIEKLAADVRVLRQEVKGTQKPSEQNQA